MTGPFHTRIAINMIFASLLVLRVCWEVWLSGHMRMGSVIFSFFLLLMHYRPISSHIQLLFTLQPRKHMKHRLKRIKGKRK